MSRSLSEQPLDIVKIIASHLNLRSLFKFSLTCKRYRKALEPLIESTKDKLFVRSSMKTNTAGKYIVFFPGPCIASYLRPLGLPSDGVYFFDSGDEFMLFGPNFFFQKDQKRDYLDAECVATVQTTEVSGKYILNVEYSTESKKIYWHDHMKGDYHKFFAFGKQKMINFWNKF